MREKKRYKYRYDDVTVIRLRRQTREKLAEIGKKGETCDDIVCRLIREQRPRIKKREEIC